MHQNQSTTLRHEALQTQLRAADDYRRRNVYQLDTTSHLNPKHNRTAIRGHVHVLAGNRRTEGGQHSSDAAHQGEDPRPRC